MTWSLPGGGETTASAAATSARLETQREGRFRGQQRVVHVDGAGQRSGDPLTRAR